MLEKLKNLFKSKKKDRKPYPQSLGVTKEPDEHRIVNNVVIGSNWGMDFSSMPSTTVISGNIFDDGETKTEKVVDFSKSEVKGDLHDSKQDSTD